MPGYNSRVNTSPPSVLTYSDPVAGTDSHYDVWFDLDAGIEESDRDGRAEAKVTFRCAWGQRNGVVKALRGATWKDESTGAVHRVGAMAYPPSPELICLEITSVTNWGAYTGADGDGWPTWEWARVVARFGTPPYDKETFGSVSLATSGEVMTFDDTTWRFVDGSATPVNVPTGIPMPHTEICYKRHRFPYLPQDQIDALIGTVNDAPFIIGNREYDQGQLLFLGADTESEYTSAGVEYTLNYKFVRRPVHWNYYFHKASSSWVPVTSDGTLGGRTPFLLADFTILPG